MRRKYVLFVLVVLCFISLSPIRANAESMSAYDKTLQSSMDYVASTNESIFISGNATVVNLALQNVTIDRSDAISISAIKITDGATVRLTITGTNTLKGADGCAAISVSEDSTLIIEEASTGTLKVYGGIMAAAIGGDDGCNNGTVIINGGTIISRGGGNGGEFADERGGAGIGGGNNGDGGTITINGGTVNTTGGDTSCGLGSGNRGGTGTIVINGGIINANGGYHGAGIGGRSGSITINDGVVTADNWAYGAAIGCTAYDDGVTITINGGTITATADTFCAAIGGSYSGTAGVITITGGNITAHGEEAGIGISSSVTITGGTISAKADAGGTGIKSTDIAISGGVIEATGGSDGAGIGGSNGKVAISGGTITAIGGYGSAGIGGASEQAGGTIEITGGSIKAVAGCAEAEDIGAGLDGAAGTLTSGLETGNQPLHLVAIQNAVNTENSIKATVTVTAGTGDDTYNYTYEGYGHSEDELLYFYLPENFTLPSGLTEYDTSLLDGYDTHLLESGNYTLSEGENVRITGESVVVTLTLPGINIDRSSDVSVSAIKITDGATVRLTITGTNTLKGADGCAAISVSEDSTLIIEEASTGTLNAYGGILAAGIGGDDGCNNGTVIINGGTIVAKGGTNGGEFADKRGGAAIGGGNSGDGGVIIINGGSITATGSGNGKGSGGGSGIGSGYYGGTGSITINGGTIVTKGGYYGAGIGGSGGSITINDGTITANNWCYGEAIGCAYYGGTSSGVVITINGGTIKATASSFASAIGGGFGVTSGKITITGGTIIASGDAAGIGESTSIEITGGNITATADAGGTGIKSPTITIRNGTINAIGGTEGAGIGGSEGVITISGGTVTATGGYNASGVGGAGIGGASGQSGGTIVITGGSIKATPGSASADSVGSGSNGAESIVTNGLEFGNQPLQLVTVKKSLFAEGDSIAARISAGSTDKSYTYKYFGIGHENDELLYFYLPEQYTGIIMTDDATCLLQSSYAVAAGATKGFVAAYDVNGKMLSVAMVDPTANSVSIGSNEDAMEIGVFYVDDAFVPVVEKRTIITNEDFADYNEFRNLFTVTLRESTDNNEQLFDAVYNGQKSQPEFWDQWSKYLSDVDSLEYYAEWLAAEVSKEYPGYTSALYFKYGTTSLGYSFAYPYGNFATSFVPNPFNIHDVDTSVDINLSAPAQELLDMFSITYKRATTSNELLYEAIYSGELSENEFVAVWNKRIENGEVVPYAKEMAIALQNKNSEYIVSLTFKYGTERLGYVFRYIGHDIASFNLISFS